MNKRFEEMKEKAGAGVHYEKNTTINDETYYEVYVGNRIIGTMQKKSSDIWRASLHNVPPLAGDDAAVEMVDCLDKLIDRYVENKGRGHREGGN